MSRKKPKGLCRTKFCRNLSNAAGGHYCSKCKMRVWRACNPLKSILSSLRNRARRKGIPYDLDLDWLDEFLTTHDFNRSLHQIDRICVLGGYTKGNLQLLPYSENIAKGNRERYGQAHLF